MELEVEGRRPVGRPKKTWSKVVEEDMYWIQGIRPSVSAVRELNN